MQQIVSQIHSFFFIMSYLDKLPQLKLIPYVIRSNTLNIDELFLKLILNLWIVLRPIVNHLLYPRVILRQTLHPGIVLRLILIR